MKQGYLFGVFRYILKTEPREFILKQIDEIYNEFYIRNKTISGTYMGCDFNLFIKDINYIEAHSHVLYIFTYKGIYKMRAALSDIEEMLDCPDFVQCHRSFIVNLNYVHSIKNSKEILLLNSNFAPVPIGKKYLKSFRRAYDEKFGKIYADMCE